MNFSPCPKKRNYDLEERTAKLAEQIIDLAKRIRIDAINQRIITQLIGAVGSCGANYCEATEAESKKDFIHKISICKKEIKEARHWLRLLARSNPECRIELRNYWKEAQELLLIFAQITRSARRT